MRHHFPLQVIALLILGAVPLAPTAAQEAAATGSAVTQICLAPVSVEAAPADVDPVPAVSEAFSLFLNGPTLAVQPLTSRLESQARQEAKLGGCGFLLLTTLKHERHTGGSGLLGRMAGGAVQQGAWTAAGSVSSTVGRVAAAAAAGAAATSVNSYATTSRQKDQLTLTYRLENASGKMLVEKSEKRKAKSDGEDLLTPLVQKASEAIAAAVTAGS